jgi:NitT/TauT family transport system ATP-binding protein
MKPAVLLMDEPFAALDALTRQEMQRELMGLWEEIRFTMLFVTHSIPEALVLGNRIALLSSHPGRITAEVRVEDAWQSGERKAVQRSLHDKIQEMLFDGALDYTI